MTQLGLVIFLRNSHGVTMYIVIEIFSRVLFIDETITQQIVNPFSDHATLIKLSTFSTELISLVVNNFENE